MNRIIIFILALSCHLVVVAQAPADSSNRMQVDSIRRADSLRKLSAAITSDSTSKKPMTPAWVPGPGVNPTTPGFTNELLRHHTWYGFSATPQVLPPGIWRYVKGKELLFYVLTGLLILFAILRRAFQKYFADLFRLFFRTTLKQRQVKEQLVQTPLPALLLNIFFVIVGGFYISFLLQHYDLNPFSNFWILLMYSAGGLAAAYLVKFIGLKIAGWLFSMPQAADAYIFIVFIVNKMIGILLLPFVIILAFAGGDVLSAGLMLSWCLVAALLGYRFILTYGAVHNQIKVNPFHFILYLLAFEVAPLLIVYKALVLFFGITT